MIRAETSEHLAIDLGLQNAFNRDVETTAERETRRHINVGNAQCPGIVADMEYLTTQYIMSHDRDAPRSRQPNPPCRYLIRSRNLQ